MAEISGLENITAQSIQDLEIIYNGALAECSIQSICDYLANPGGSVTIEENAPECNSPEEVEAACETVGVENAMIENEYSMFPNPANQLVAFTNKSETTISEVTIYNQTGQKVYGGIPENNTLNISKLQPGMYVVELATKEGNVRKKLIIQ